MQQIRCKESKFYLVNFPDCSQFGEFYLTQQEIQEYTQMIKLNPHWKVEMAQKSIIHLSHQGNQISASQLSFEMQEDHQFDAKMKQIIEFYREHNIDDAYKQMRQLLIKFPNKYKQNRQHRELLSQIQRQYNDVIQFSAPIRQSGWILKDQNKGVKIFTKNIKNQPCILIQSGVSVPAQIFLQAMVQLDLFNKIIPMVQYSKEEKILARNMKIGNFVVDVPVLSSREAFYQGVGYDRLGTNGTVFLFIRSIHNDPDLLKQLNYQPKFHPKTVPLNFKFIDLEYTPITANSGVCRLCFNIDLDMKIIPNWVLEKVLRTFSSKIFENIMKVSQNFKGSEWEKRAIQNPILFSFFQQKSRDYFRLK